MNFRKIELSTLNNIFLKICMPVTVSCSEENEVLVDNNPTPKFVGNVEFCGFATQHDHNVQRQVQSGGEKA